MSDHHTFVSTEENQQRIKAEREEIAAAMGICLAGGVVPKHMTDPELDVVAEYQASEAEKAKAAEAADEQRLADEIVSSFKM